jgi:transcriptional regulator with XRE-family HTH domain
MLRSLEENPLVHSPVPSSEITEALIHIRDLFRRIRPSNEHESRAMERREAATKDLLSNLPRTNEHPTLRTLLEIAEIYRLTLEGAHELFGYDLRELRKWDLYLNGDRTHIERPHERLCTGEIHRPLCMGNAGVCEREKRRPQHTRCVKQFASAEELRQSLGKMGCAAGNLGMAFTKHRHLRRLVSVGNMP